MSDVTPDVLPYARGAREIALRVRVSPRAGRAAVGGVVRDAEGRASLVVRVTEAPDKGKANAAVIAALAKRLKVAKSRLSITAGHAARTKTVAIAGDPADYEPALRGLLKPDREE